VNWKTLRSALNDIESACEAMDTKALKDLLLQLVPEYDQPGDADIIGNSDSKVVYLKS